MGTWDDIRTRRKQLAARVQDNWERRAGERKRLLDAVEQRGILGAAGTESAIRRAAHMTIAEGRVVAARRTKEIEGERSLEAIVGIDDSDHINFMGRGQIAARAVCRLVLDGQAVGTGFLVAPGVLLTNNHVVENERDASRFVAEFDYELDLDDQPRVPVVRFQLDPKTLFVTSDADDGFDFTCVAVRERSLNGGKRIGEFGWIPLDDRIDKILVAEPAVIIQHPRGEPKRVCIFSAELVDKLEDHLHYTTDTDGGSSGSAVFNRSWQLVGLHHAAVRSNQQQRRGRPIVVNEGIRVSSIIRALAERRKVVGHVERALAAVTGHDVIRDGRPQAKTEESSVLRTLEKTKIGRREKDHFDGRSEKHFGYKPAFLGVDVPLPTIARAMRRDVAPELKYTHYSVLFSTSRRLPVVTAVNIAGAQSVPLGRLDRDFEAADKWFYDPRLEDDDQLEPPVYDRTDFDFGHMVRREDPVWGDDNTARMANDDTFYMTNCAPQHSSLNTKTWLKLENAILHAARRWGRKVSVFTGPVLTPGDPEVLDVQVPTAFWKIVAYVEDGRLVAHGFIQRQDDLVRKLKIRKEALTDDIGKAEEWQLTIAEIGDETGLDFGPLVEADSLGGFESRRRRERRLDDEVIEELFGDDPPRREIRPRTPVRFASGPVTREELVEALEAMQAILARVLEPKTNGNGRRERHSDA